VYILQPTESEVELLVYLGLLFIEVAFILIQFSHVLNLPVSSVLTGFAVARILQFIIWSPTRFIFACQDIVVNGSYLLDSRSLD